VTESAPLRPNKRHALTPRFTLPKSLVRIQSIPNRIPSIPHRLVGRRLPKATIGAAAVAAVATAGIVTGLSVGSAPSAAAKHAGNFSQALDLRGAQHAAGGGSHSSVESRSAHQAAGGHATQAKHQALARQHKAAPAKAAGPYRFYDSVTPSAFPPHSVVATYATGSYTVSPSQVAGQKTVIWIDVTGYDYAASALDVEPGDATPTLAASWAMHRLQAHPKAIARIYTMLSEWPAVKAAVAALPAKMRSHIRYWIADPTGYPHIVPGSSATQWYWGTNIDISTATPGF
jgi:hypothetical protein